MQPAKKLPQKTCQACLPITYQPHDLSAPNTSLWRVLAERTHDATCAHPETSNRQSIEHSTVSSAHKHAQACISRKTRMTQHVASHSSELSRLPLGRLPAEVCQVIQKSPMLHTCITINCSASARVHHRHFVQQANHTLHICISCVSVTSPIHQTPYHAIAPQSCLCLGDC